MWELLAEGSRVGAFCAMPPPALVRIFTFTFFGIFSVAVGVVMVVGAVVALGMCVGVVGAEMGAGMVVVGGGGGGAAAVAGPVVRV